MLKHYEITFLFRPDAVLEDIANTMLLIRDEMLLQDKNCKVLHSEYWGSRQLEYVINKNKSAHFYHLQILSKKELNNFFIERFKINDSIIRFLLIECDKEELGIVSSNSKMNKNDENVVFEERYKQVLSIFNV